MTNKVTHVALLVDSPLIVPSEVAAEVLRLLAPYLGREVRISWDGKVTVEKNMQNLSIKAFSPEQLAMLALDRPE